MVEHVALCVCPKVVQMKQDQSVREMRVCVVGVVTGDFPCMHAYSAVLLVMHSPAPRLGFRWTPVLHLMLL